MESAFIRKINVHITVFEFVVCAEQEIGEKQFQKLCGRMNALLQIIIVCPDQCVAEIPGVFTERIVIDAEPKGFHIFNHKYGGGTGVSLAEGMDLPNIRCKLCEVLYRCFNRQSLIRKLFFGGEIIVQSFFNAVPIRIDHGIAAQHPLFLCDVILPNLSGVVKYALKQSAVNGNPLGGGKLKRFFSQQLRYSCRNDICLFGFVFRFGSRGALFIITVNPLLRFINGDFALNVILCGVQQIGRSIQPVNCLQADGSLPRLAFFGSVGFALLYIFFKFKLPILIRHICTSFLA